MTWMDKFVAFDTETTGFGSHARVIEIACVLFENGEVKDEWSSLIYPPDVDWSHPKVQEALSVNQVDPKLLEGKPQFQEIFHRLYLSFNSAPVWVAHNASFDLRMISQEYTLYKNEPFPVRPAEACLCTQLLSSRLHSNEKGHKLQDAARRWGVVQEGAHRAASDAITCGRILSAMAKEHLPKDIGQVNELQKTASARWGDRGRR